MPRVGIITLGFVPFDANELCRWINGVQDYLRFEKATELMNLGQPDLHGIEYSDTKIYSMVTNHVDGYEYLGLVTSVPIEGNYFTRTLSNNIVLLTFHETEDLLKDSMRTAEQYVALALVQELLSFEFQRVSGLRWTDLFHADPRGCIFDFAKYKRQKLFKLKTCAICDICFGKLHSANVDNRLLSASIRIIEHIVRPTAKKSFLACSQQPSLSFLYSGIVLSTVVNLFSSLVLSSTTSHSQWILFACVASGIVILPALKFAADWVSFVRTRRQRI
jgi:hypothetical protein